MQQHIKKGSGASSKRAALLDNLWIFEEAVGDQRPEKRSLMAAEPLEACSLLERLLE